MAAEADRFRENGYFGEKIQSVLPQVEQAADPSLCFHFAGPLFRHLGSFSGPEAYLCCDAQSPYFGKVLQWAVHKTMLFFVVRSWLAQTRRTNPLRENSATLNWRGRGEEDQTQS